VGKKYVVSLKNIIKSFKLLLIEICLDFVFGSQKVKNADKSKGETLSMFALTTDGIIWAWGNNEHGNLGIRVCSKIPSAPQRVPISVMVVQLVCGSGHALALSSEGFVWAWGRNFYGQVGNRNLQDHPFPVPIKISDEKLIMVRMVACGSRHSVVMTSEGEVFIFTHF
jgi:alpha-tubulin suppressor-like RCC1 family protein